MQEARLQLYYDALEFFLQDLKADEAPRKITLADATAWEWLEEFMDHRRIRLTTMMVGGVLGEWFVRKALQGWILLTESLESYEPDEHRRNQILDINVRVLEIIGANRVKNYTTEWERERTMAEILLVLKN
ncbi:hypothetical protein HDU93_006104, partial [Gonapodya sp. JEL0774]